MCQFELEMKWTPHDDDDDDDDAFFSPDKHVEAERLPRSTEQRSVTVEETGEERHDPQNVLQQTTTSVKHRHSIQ